MPRYFTEQARTPRECEEKIRAKYGDRVTILMQRTILKGGLFGLFGHEEVEMTGIVPNSSAKTYPPGSVTPRSGAVQRNESAYKEPLDFDEEKRKILSMTSRDKDKDGALQAVLNEVKKLSDKIDSQTPQPSGEDHPTIGRIEDLLILNDFSAPYRATILERIKKELPLETLSDYDEVQDKVVEWIGESIRIYEGDQFHHQPWIMVLVGPTGVGKTTTIAKLAANFGIDSNARIKRQVVLITIDAFRIGAQEQFEKYCDILQFPYFAVHDYTDLKRVIDTNSEGTDLILIDTTGKSPRDAVSLGEMKALLDACGSFAEIHLAVAATTKTSDIKEILQQFEPFKYRSAIITKLDETIRIGNVISALSEKSKPLSYITNGQKVPQHIQRASVVSFLVNLEGFRINRVKVEEKFPDNDNDKIQEWR